MQVTFNKERMARIIKLCGEEDASTVAVLNRAVDFYYNEKVVKNESQPERVGNGKTREG